MPTTDSQPHIFVRRNQMTYEELYGDDLKYKEVNAQVAAEIERLNPVLYSLFPILHERLKSRYDAELQAWMSTCSCPRNLKLADSKPMKYQTNKIIKQINKRLGASNVLKMQGYDSICVVNYLSEDDEEAIRKVVTRHIEKLTPELAIKNIVTQIQDGTFAGDGEDKEDVIFFIWAVMREVGVSEGASDLWILTYGDWDENDYMFLLEDGAGLNSAWRLCEDLLPPEVVSVLDMEYL